MAHFIERDGVRIHYLRHQGPEPPLILLHGLTANAHYFDGLVRAGLADVRGALAVDLRGRGLSGQPASGYTMADHAADVIALLDHAGIERAVLCGHSYGGLLTLYLTNEHPERVDRAILLDIAGPTVQNPLVFELLQPSLARLGRSFPSMDAFLDQMKAQPSLAGAWDQDVERYFRADVEPLPGGAVRVRTPREVIYQVVLEAQKVDWHLCLAQAAVPTLLVHAGGPFGPPGTPPLVLEEQAREAALLLPECRCARVPGNHMSMMFGDSARVVLAEIRAFLAG